MKKHVLILLTLALGLSALFASAAFADEPVMGGVLRWHEINDPPKVDPAHVYDTTSSRVVYLMFDSLVENDADGKGVTPALAESWEGSDGGKVWTFHLRKGVHFQKETEGQPTANGGREVKAADWKYSFERLVYENSPRAYFLDMVKGYQDFISRDETGAKEWAGIKVVDDYTLQFELEYPFAPFVAVLAYNTFVVIPKEDAEKWGKEFNFHPVGTGPFCFEKWEHDQKFVTKRNPDYWRKDDAGRQLPYLDGVEIVVIPDPTIVYEEYKKGNIDCYRDVPDEFYEDVQANYKSVFQERPQLGTYYYGFNNEVGDFAGPEKLKLRQAFNYAVDRNRISELVLNGRYPAARGVLPPGFPGYNENLKGYEYNPEKAKELMKEAGYPEGFEVELLVNNNPRHKAVGEAIQAQVAELGIKMSIKVLDWGVMLDLCDRGEVNLFRMGWVVDYADPDNFLYVLFHSSNKGAKGNYSRYSNPEFDKLVEEARVETDYAKRMDLYQKAEQILVDDAAWLFLFHYSNSLLYQPWVKNIHMPAFGDYTTPLYNVWVQK